MEKYKLNLLEQPLDLDQEDLLRTGMSWEKDLKEPRLQPCIKTMLSCSQRLLFKVLNKAQQRKIWLLY